MEVAQGPPVKIIRPREYDSTPVYEPSITESCLNRFRMQIDPLYFDKQRASFSWKAPGNSLLASNNCFIECSFKITTPPFRRLDYRTQTAPTVQIRDADTGLAGVGGDGGAEHNPAILQAVKLAFASGCGFSQALTNVQLIVNGAALSNSRQNDYVQALDLAWLSKTTMQKRFSRCG